MSDRATCALPTWAFPRAWNASKTVEVLALERPVLRVRGGNTPWLDGRPEAAVAGARTEEAKSGTAGSGTPFWQQLHFRRFEIAEGAIDFAEWQWLRLTARRRTPLVTPRHLRLAIEALDAGERRNEVDGVVLHRHQGDAAMRLAAP